MRHLAPAAAAAAALALLAACSEKPAESDDGAIGVLATDDACEVAVSEAEAGTVTFTIKNEGTKVNEFYVYAEGNRVMGEVENITPGLTRELIVELPADAYETACKPGMIGDGIRADFTVTGEAASLSEDQALQDAVDSYKRYVESQSAGLVEQTELFAEAVRAGDIEGAKALFPVARTYWERIEPVAEIFGDLDPRIDAREDDYPEGPTDPAFTGFHKLEYDLWITGDLSESGPIADQLVADVNEIVALAAAEELSPLQLANGAKALLDEIASFKITGEEDRYSHTDLWDFAANLEGSEGAIASMRPVLDERDPDLVAALDEEFANAWAALEQHREGDGWRLHDELTPEELQELSDAINALGEQVSKVAAVVAE
ncbi:iron uptake system protein EfeO [Glycomyces algeriensis]|uniref:Lipoprotein n=1 Tax=Glycomyces algeriensis TaxID=256037 RepID=A0A9W6GC35_9ACTN|nr:iron uptake system protein EfeO [Glycomyces algeriensis]MDA1365669.1 peptidase M75 family protein [Glycomyces algeriensis]MDR7351357.1 iron uptake system component EfeO [Glycomyces algeriensis]GLI44072.1 lipoprotein [Glycomyces algeriensis]